MASIKKLDERRYKITVSTGYRPNGKKISKAKTIQVPPGVPKRGISQFVAHAAEELERALEARGIDVFVDDRDERPGVKFKDADLIGCTVRVVVGTRGLEKGGVEVRLRKTGETSLVPIADAPAAIAALLASR